MFERWKHRTADVPPPLTALAITRSQADRIPLERIFEKAGWQILFVDGIEAAARQTAQRALLYDRDLPGVDWRQAIRQLASPQAGRVVFLASSVVDDYLWEEVIHLGGYDVLSKPFRESEVIRAFEFARAALTKSLPSAPRTR